MKAFSNGDWVRIKDGADEGRVGVVTGVFKRHHGPGGCEYQVIIDEARGMNGKIMDGKCMLYPECCLALVSGVIRAEWDSEAI
jgi:ribosomal protein L24